MFNEPSSCSTNKRERAGEKWAQLSRLSTVTSKILFSNFLFLLRSFRRFIVSVLSLISRLRCINHLVDWWHFASISCGKSVALIITDIPSHHTLAISCGWPKYLSWSSFEWIYVHLSKVYPMRLAQVMKTSESCVVVCHLGSLSCHSIDRTQLIFDYANYIVSSCSRLRFKRKPTRKKLKLLPITPWSITSFPDV